MSVAVVIAVFNERENLPRLLASLERQTHPPVEVIVVDDGSTDGTHNAAGGYEVTVLRQPHLGAATARNNGVAISDADIIVFIDGDMRAGNTFVEALVRPITAGATGSFTKEIYIGNSQNPWARAYGRIRRQPLPRLIPANFPDEWENFRAIRREAFLAVGGYDDVGYGEDMTLAPKLGELAVAAPGAVCWHDNPSSLREVHENGRWIGRGHDIELRAALRAANPAAVVSSSVLDSLRTRSPAPLLARTAYHVGVLTGLVDQRLGRQHAK